MKALILLFPFVTILLGFPITKGPQIVKFTRPRGPFHTRGPLNKSTLAPLNFVASKKPHGINTDSIGHFSTSAAPQLHFTNDRQVLANKFLSSGTKRPPVDAATSRKPHVTRPPKEEGLAKGTFAPGAFTHKFTLPPLHKKTFAPLDLVASKEPHGTNYPAVEELNVSA